MMPEVLFDLTRLWMSMAVSAAGAALLASAVLWCVCHLTRSRVRIDELIPANNRLIATTIVHSLTYDVPVRVLGHEGLLTRTYLLLTDKSAILLLFQVNNGIPGTVSTISIKPRHKSSSSSSELDIRLSSLPTRHVDYMPSTVHALQSFRDLPLAFDMCAASYLLVCAQQSYCRTYYTRCCCSITAAQYWSMVMPHRRLPTSVHPSTATSGATQQPCLTRVQDSPIYEVVAMMR